MIRVQRLLYYIAILVFFAFISITIFPHLKASNPSPVEEQIETTINKPTRKPSGPNEEKYLSWFPHR